MQLHTNRPSHFSAGDNIICTCETERRYIVSSLSCSLMRSATAPAAQGRAGQQAQQRACPLLEACSLRAAGAEAGRARVARWRAGTCKRAGVCWMANHSAADNSQCSTAIPSWLCIALHASWAAEQRMAVPSCTHAACDGRGHARRTAPLPAYTSLPAALQGRTERTGAAMKTAGSCPWLPSAQQSPSNRALHPSLLPKPDPGPHPRPPPAPLACASPAAACTRGALARCACCSTSVTSPAATARRAADSARYSPLQNRQGGGQALKLRLCNLQLS